MNVIALIKAGVVDNIISGSIDFAHSIGYADAVDISALNPQPAIGWTYDGAAFHALSSARPTMVITAITADAGHAAQTVIKPGLGDVTCPVGTVLTVTSELRSPSGLVPLTDTFRMPLLARDGRELMLLASLVSGVATITVPLRDSGAWQVTEESINSGLPEAMHMHFSGITAYVIEA